MTSPNPRTVFISRELSASSPFLSILQAQGWQVAAHSLLELRLLPFFQIPPADWVFFYSQHAVRFFFEHAAAQNLACPGAKWAAIGSSTGEILAKYLQKDPNIAQNAPDFIGTGDPNSTASSFLEIARGATVLFPCAQHSRHSIEQILGGAISSTAFPVYDNRPVADPPRSDAAVLVFTSPLNAEVYFSKHARQAGQRVLAIGETTAAALRFLGISDVEIAAAASEAGLVAGVLGNP